MCHVPNDKSVLLRGTGHLARLQTDVCRAFWCIRVAIWSGMRGASNCNAPSPCISTFDNIGCVVITCSLGLLIFLYFFFFRRSRFLLFFFGMARAAITFCFGCLVVVAQSLSHWPTATTVAYGVFAKTWPVDQCRRPFHAILCVWACRASERTSSHQWDTHVCCLALCNSPYCLLFVVKMMRVSWISWSLLPPPPFEMKTMNIMYHLGRMMRCCLANQVVTVWLAVFISINDSGKQETY